MPAKKHKICIYFWAKALQQKGYAVGRSAARSLMQKAAVECKMRFKWLWHDVIPSLDYCITLIVVLQYASDHYRATLKSVGILVSMSRSGNCWDNAVMERVWGSLKSERTDGKMYTTREEGKKEVIDYFEMFYNSIRLHSTLGYKSPMQFENEFLLKNVSTFT